MDSENVADVERWRGFVIGNERGECLNYFSCVSLAHADGDRKARVCVHNCKIVGKIDGWYENLLAWVDLDVQGDHRAREEGMLVRLAFASCGEARARDVAHLAKWLGFRVVVPTENPGRRSRVS